MKSAAAAFRCSLLLTLRCSRLRSSRNTTVSSIPAKAAGKVIGGLTRPAPTKLTFLPFTLQSANIPQSNRASGQAASTIALERRQIHTWVQKADAECLNCGGLGTATASFQLVHGVAKAAQVTFEPDADH